MNSPRINLRQHSKRNLWEARVSVNGKRKSFYDANSEKAKAKAHDYLSTIGLIEQREEVKRRAEAFTDSLAIWTVRNIAPHYASSKKPSTREQGEWGIGVLVKAFGEQKISELSLGTALVIWARICADYQSENTRRSLRKYLFRTFRLLAREKRIEYNYFEEIEAPETTKREHVPSVEESMRLWLVNKDDYLGPKIFLEFALGLTDTEANSVQIEDLTDDTLFVRGPKNDYRRRTIHLSPAIAAVLHSYTVGKRRYLCETVKGERICDGSTTSLRLRYKRAHVEYAGNHGLRHAFAHIETHAACPPSVRMAIMGQSTKHVQGLYVHPTPANVRECLKKWEEFLGLPSIVCLPVSGVQTGVRVF